MKTQLLIIPVLRVGDFGTLGRVAYFLPGYLCAWSELRGAVRCFLAIAQGAAYIRSPRLAGRQLIAENHSCWRGETAPHCLLFAALYLLTNSKGEEGSSHLGKLCTFRPSHMTQIYLRYLTVLPASSGASP